MLLSSLILQCAEKGTPPLQLQVTGKQERGGAVGDLGGDTGVIGECDRLSNTAGFFLLA